MTGPLLALLLAAAAPDALGQARAAFASGDFGRAEALGLQAAGPVGQPEALYLVALARFRAGKPAEALAALDRSRDGAESDGAWWFNRGACLYALGRWDEARVAFLESARSPELTAVALANAGFAALDAGDRDGAAALALRARAAASGKALELVEDLERQLAPPTPAAPAPPPPDRLVVRGRLMGGYDSDALLSGLGPVERPGVSPLTAPSSVLLADADATARLQLGESTRGELTYAFSQLLYGDTQAEDQSVQTHDLTAALRFAPARRLELGLTLGGQLAFAGRTDFRPLQVAAAARGWAALDEGEQATTRLDLGWTGKEGQGGEFQALTGRRLEAGLWQEGRWRAVTLRLGYRFQREDIGETTAALPDVAPSPICPEGCTAVAVEPLSYDGQLLWAWGQLRPMARLSLELGAAWEQRRGLEDARTVLTRPDGSSVATAPVRGEDRRLFTTASLGFRLSRSTTLLLRHEWLQREATASGGEQHHGGGMMTGGGSWADAATRSKQVLLLGTSLAW